MQNIISIKNDIKSTYILRIQIKRKMFFAFKNES